MERINVKSSSISSIGYDNAKAILEVEFTSGGLYQYTGVPKELYEKLLAAPSHGRFFDKHIRKAGFPFERIK